MYFFAKNKNKKKKLWNECMSQISCCPLVFQNIEDNIVHKLVYTLIVNNITYK